MSRTQISAEPGIPLITVTRDFDAPRDLGLRAYTDPELLVPRSGRPELARLAKPCPASVPSPATSMPHRCCCPRDVRSIVVAMVLSHGLLQNRAGSGASFVGVHDCLR